MVVVRLVFSEGYARKYCQCASSEIVIPHQPSFQYFHVPNETASPFRFLLLQEPMVEFRPPFDHNMVAQGGAQFWRTCDQCKEMQIRETPSFSSAAMALKLILIKRRLNLALDD